VVPTLTVTVCVEPPLSGMLEFDRVHVAGGVTTGATAQVRFALPLNEGAAAKTSEKFAVCPALMVWEVLDPAAAPMVKSDEMASTTPAP